MLHLAQKAFAPGKLPFPLLHVDTTWKFREMIAFRDKTAARLGLALLVHVNQDGVRRGISPIASGSAVHTLVMRTEALRGALEKWKFDLAFGGARRDEERSRAKERIFSLRTAAHTWDPRNQRLELWKLFNTRIRACESLRVFPLSNWTELDVWEYIRAEDIPVELYFAKPRPMVERDGLLIMVDDTRLPLLSGETSRMVSVRFRTLGCYLLTGAIWYARRHHRRDAHVVEFRAAGPLDRSGRERSMEKRSARDTSNARGRYSRADESGDRTGAYPASATLSYLRLGRRRKIDAYWASAA